MLEWISANSSLISVAISALMLAVWVTYLQLLFVQYRAARRFSVLVTRAAGKGIRSRCMITNMSAQPVYVTSLIGTLHLADRQIELALTDLRELPDDLGQDPRSAMRQGSLSTGQYLNIGHFDEIVRAMLDANAESDVEVGDVRQLDLTAVALYSSDELPVGAARSFAFSPRGDGTLKVQPLSITTEQIRKRNARRILLEKATYHT